MAGIIAVNGKLAEPETATISALDRGLLFGDNVFEVLVAFGAKILDLEAHLARLQYSADEIGLALPWSLEQLAFELQEVCSQLAAPKAYLRLVVTRGNGLSLEIPSPCQPTRLIYAFPARPLDPLLYREGLALKLKKLAYTQRRPQVKTGNYLPSILALSKAQQEGFHDVLWVNSEGELCEATTANIFLIGRLGDEVEILTPSLQSGILKGITRSNILRLLQTAGIPAREEIIYNDELARFDEAFVSSTVKGLLPIRRLGEQQLCSARPSSVFRQIERLFFAWVTKEVGYRLDWNSGNPIST